MACIIELWETVGDQGTVHTPACLSCGWQGGDGTRAEAERKRAMHERGERHPWQTGPDEHRVFEGDPRSFPDL